MKPTLIWFRHDLRLSDNPALVAAVRQRAPIIPVFIWAPEEEGSWAPGAASRWWLYQSLSSLGVELAKRGSALVIRKGPSLAALRQLVVETGAASVFWNRRYEPSIIMRDTAVEEALRSHGVDVRTFNAGLLFEPGSVRTKAGKPFQVFTAFWNNRQREPDPPTPVATPAKLPLAANCPKSLPLAELGLEHGSGWATGLRQFWQPGEHGAAVELKRFLNSGLERYTTDRERPDRAGTSRLSPHLHFGEIGPRQVWHTIKKHTAPQNGTQGLRAAESYLREILWREFAHHVLHHFPNTPEKSLRPQFARFPWRNDPRALAAWQRGKTGYPIVDAGMRELLTTGWMHNRVRMIVASFLVKDLLVPWQAGARWFWERLVDADLANNTLNWQWVAGCGADAAPYFRIFNPVSQSKKFDPNGDYVRLWVPELRRLATRWIHKPWQAPAEVLKSAGIELGSAYTSPIVDHGLARQRALAALGSVRKDRNR